MTLLNHSWSLLAFSITLISVPFWPVLPSLGWISAILALTLLSLNYRRMRSLSVVLIAILLGIVHGNLAQQQTQRLFENGLNITIKAQVNSFFHQIRHGYEGTVLIRSINGQELPIFLPIKVRLISPVALNIDDMVYAKVRLKRIIGWLNPKGYDKEAVAMSNGTLGQATLNERYSWRVESDFSIKQRLYQRVKSSFNDTDMQGIVLALTFGERKDIAPQQWLQMQQMGLIHLIAISGLHIQLVFSWSVILVRLLFKGGVVSRWLPHACGLGLALSYAWLSGFSAPTVRALLTCLLITALAAANLHNARKSKWLLILSIMLAINPFYTLSASFWMSFAAVATIYYALSQHSERTWWQQALLMQAYLTIFLAPIAIYLFNGISLSAWLLNLIAVPIFTFLVMPSVLLALAVDFLQVLWSVEWLEPWLWVTWALWPINQLLVQDLGWWLDTTQCSLWLSIAVCFALLSRHYLSLNGVCWCSALLLLMMIFSSQPKRWQLVVFDVGHGLAVAIRDQHAVYLYDVAASWPSGSVAQNLLVPWLRWRGVQSLDGVFISHDDNDHAGGLSDLRQSIDIKKVIGSLGVSSTDACIAGKVYKLVTLEVKVLWPKSQPNRAYNPHSCVIRIEDTKSGLSILLTGDIDAVSEYLLSRGKQSLQSDIILVPHHGSSTSSTKGLIDRVNPQVSISSNAYQGRWQLPNKDVVKRYTQHGATWYDTGRDGMLTIDVYDNYWQVTPSRTGTKNSWYRQMLRNRVE